MNIIGTFKYKSSVLKIILNTMCIFLFISGRENSQELNTINQIQTELKKQFAVKNSVDQKQSEQKLLMLEAASMSAIPTVKNGLDQPVASSVNNSANDGPSFETALTLEQMKSWQNAVVDWLSRPCPLSTKDLESGISHGLRDIDTSEASVIRRRRSAEAVNLRTHLQDADIRLNVSSEKYKLPARKPVTGLLVVNKPSQSQHTDVLKHHDGRHSDNPELVRSREHIEDQRLKTEHLVKEMKKMEFKSPGGGTSSNTNIYSANSDTTTSGIESECQLVPTSKVTTLFMTSTASSLKYEVNVEDGVKKAIEEQMRLKQHGQYQLNGDGGVRSTSEAKVKEQHISRSKYEVLVEEPVEEAVEKVQNQDNVSKCQSDVQGAKLSVKEGKKMTKSVSKSNNTKETSAVRTTSDEEVTSSFKENKSGSSVKQQHTKGITSAMVIGDKRIGINKKREAEVPRPVEKSLNKRAKVSQIGKDKNSVTVLKTSENCSQSLKPHLFEMEVPELSEDPLPAIQTITSSCFQSSEKASQASQKPKLKLILSTKRDALKGSILAECDNRGNHTADGETFSQTAKLGSQGGDHSKQVLVKGGTERKSTDSAEVINKSPCGEKITVASPSVSVLGSVSPITVVSSKGRYHSPVSPSVSTAAAVHSPPASLLPFSPPLPPAAPFIPPSPQGPFRSPILLDVAQGSTYSSVRPDHIPTMQPSHLMPLSPGISPPGPPIGSPPVLPAVRPILPLNLHPVISSPGPFSVVGSTPPPIGTYPVAQQMHSPLPPPPLPPPPLPPPPHSAIRSRSNSVEAPSPTSSLQIPQFCHQWNLSPPPIAGTLPTRDQLSFSHSQGTRFMTVERPRFPSPQQPFQPQARFGYTQSLGFAQSQGPQLMHEAVLSQPYGYPWAPEMPSMHHKPSPSSSQYQCTTQPFCESNLLDCESTKSSLTTCVISTASTPVSTTVSGTVRYFSQSQRTFLQSNRQNSSLETSLPKNNVEAGKRGENQVLKSNSEASLNDSYAAVQIEEDKPVNRTKELQLSLHVGHKLKPHVDVPGVSEQKMAEPVNDKKQSTWEMEKPQVVTVGEEKKGKMVGRENPEACNPLELAADRKEKLCSFLQTSASATGKQDVESVRNVSKPRLRETGASKHTVKNNTDCEISDYTDNLDHGMFNVLDATEVDDQQNIIIGSCCEDQTKNSTTCIINSANDVEDFADVACHPASSSVGIYLTEAEQKSSNAVSRIHDILQCSAQESSYEARCTDEQTDVLKGCSEDVDSNSDGKGGDGRKKLTFNSVVQTAEQGVIIII